jgi:hypothetical protein
MDRLEAKIQPLIAKDEWNATALAFDEAEIEVRNITDARSFNLFTAAPGRLCFSHTIII